MSSTKDAARALRRAKRRLRARGPMYHATGEGFKKDESTTKAVLRRMRALGVD